MEYGHYAVSKSSEAEAESKSDNSKEYDNVLAGAMGMDKSRILSFKAKAPVPASEFLFMKQNWV